MSNIFSFATYLNSSPSYYQDQCYMTDQENLNF